MTEEVACCSGVPVDDEPEPADGVSHASARPETDAAEAASHDDDDDDELALDDPSIPDELLAFGFCRSCQGMFVCLFTNKQSTDLCTQPLPNCACSKRYCAPRFPFI